MRLLTYSPDALATPYGTPSAVRAWCDALARLGVDVTLISDAGSDVVAMPAVASAVGIEHRFEHIAGGRSRVPVALSAFVADADVLVLHGGWRVANVRAAALADAHGIPYVLTPHGRYDPHIARRGGWIRAAWWRLFERPMVSRAAAVHVFFADEPTILPPEVPRIVAPNGIDPPDELSWEGGSTGSIVWLGRFDIHHKGLDLLVEAIDRLPTDVRPTVELHGHEWLRGKETLARTIARRGLSDWLRLRDPVHGSDKWKALQAAKGFVYPSRWEAFGLAVAEAASIGVPSVVTPFPLGRFLAERDAAIVADATPVSLSERLVELARSMSVRPTNGVTIMQDAFSWPVVARSWRDQLLNVLSR